MIERTLFDYWMVIYQRKKAVGIIMAAAVLSALLSSFLLPNVYEARHYFYWPTGLQSKQAGTGSGEENVPLPSGLQDQARAFTGILKSEDATRWVQAKFPDKSMESFAKDMDFSASREGLVRIFSRDPDPERAAAIASAFADYFDDLMAGQVKRRAGADLRAIDFQTDELNQRMTAIRGEKRKLQESHTVTALQTEMEELVKQRQSGQRSLDLAQVDLRGANEKIGGLEAELKRESTVYVPTDLVTNNTVVEAIQQKLSDIEIALAGKRTELRETHPEVVALEKQYAQAKKNLEREIDRVLKSQSKAPNSLYEKLRQNLTDVIVERKVLEARIVGLTQAARTVNKQIRAMPEISEGLDRLEKEERRYADLLAVLIQQRGQARNMQLGERFRAVPVQKAYPPPKQIFPLWWLNVSVALALSVIVSVCYAFFLDYVGELRRMRQFKAMEIEELMKA